MGDKCLQEFESYHLQQNQELCWPHNGSYGETQIYHSKAKRAPPGIDGNPFGHSIFNFRQ